MKLNVGSLTDLCDWKSALYLCCF